MSTGCWSIYIRLSVRAREVRDVEK